MTDSSAKIACPATHILHDPDDRENFVFKPGPRVGRFLCLVCGLRWSISNPQVRKLLVRVDLERAWRSAESVEEEPWDHPYEAGTDNVCITCGRVGSYAHTKEFYSRRIEQPA